MEVLFEDNQLLIALKSQNQLMSDLVEETKIYLTQNNKKSTYVEPLYDIDYLAGGLVLFALTSKTKQRLTLQLSDNDLTTKYFAVVVGQNKEKSNTIVCYAHTNKQTNLLELIPQLNKDAIKLQSKYTILQTNQQISLLQCVSTNVHSQENRFILSSQNMPIFGDKKYKGDTLAKHTNTALWLVELKFMHPTTKQYLTFKSYPPKTKPWTYFDVDRFLRV